MVGIESKLNVFLAHLQFSNLIISVEQAQVHMGIFAGANESTNGSTVWHIFVSTKHLAWEELVSYSIKRQDAR